ncbi:MAG: hypothetical protein ABL995_03085 [Bryobacteraceae bacterium]
MTGRSLFGSWSRLRSVAAGGLVLLAVTLPVYLSGQPAEAAGGDLDPAFANVPIEQWINGREPSQIKWEPSVLPAVLAVEQRLRARADIRLDGEEVTKRRGRGRLMTFIRFEDSQGRAYEAHNIMELKDVQDKTDKLDFVISQDAYVLPGEYQVSFAVLDTTTGEHSAARKTLRVNAIKNDPLPAAWDGLPPVELVFNTSTRTRRINVPLVSKRPLEVQLLVNMTPSLDKPSFRARPVPADTVINGLVPVFRVLSQLSVPNGKYHVGVMSLTRRKVLLEQELGPYGPGINWQQLGQAITDADPNVIDVETLRDPGRDIEFFREQIRNVLDTPEGTSEAPQKVVIVLSPPFSSSGENAKPIELESPTNARVYYLRRHVLPQLSMPGPVFVEQRLGRGRRVDPAAMNTRMGYAEPYDTLDKVLKPLRPRIFDIYTPEDLRKAMASIAEETGRM